MTSWAEEGREIHDVRLEDGEVLWKQRFVEEVWQGTDGEEPVTLWAEEEFWKICGLHTPC